MDHMMHLTKVSFSYISKVNLGGRLCIGHRQLAKTPVVIMSQCITPCADPGIFVRGVQASLTKKALTFFFFYGSSANFKEVKWSISKKSIIFQGSRGGPTFSRGGPTL